MKKRDIFEIDCSNINRQDLIDEFYRCQLFDLNPRFCGIIYEYIYELDSLCILKIPKYNVKKLVIPKIFDMLGSYSIYEFDSLEEIDASNIKYINEYAISYCGKLKRINASSCIRFCRYSISDLSSLMSIKFAPKIEFLDSNFLSCYIGQLNFNTILELNKRAFCGIYVKDININSIPYVPYLTISEFSFHINKVNGVDNRYLNETSKFMNARKDRKIYLNMSKDEFFSKILTYDKIHNLNCSIILNDGVII